MKGIQYQENKKIRRRKNKEKNRKPHGWRCGVFIVTETLTVFQA
jgi:hypothetical protein